MHLHTYKCFNIFQKDNFVVTDISTIWQNALKRHAVNITSILKLRDFPTISALISNDINRIKVPLHKKISEWTAFQTTYGV